MHEQQEQRQRLTTPKQTVRGMIFNPIFRLVSARAGQDAADRLREPLSRKPLVDFFSYPAFEFLRVLYGAADLLVSAGEAKTLETGVRQCGAASVGGFFDSGVGKTLVAIVGRGDPHRLLSNSGTAYGTTVSYGIREYTRLGDTRGLFTMREDMMPIEFHEGVFGGALLAIGAEGTVKGSSRSLTEADYLIEWSAPRR